MSFNLASRGPGPAPESLERLPPEALRTRVAGTIRCADLEFVRDLRENPASKKVLDARPEQHKRQEVARCVSR
jgi:hypothetical protein